MQQGGGIGHDFSTLRPQGAPVKGVGADASGPLSFMDVWDAMCRTIMSAGSRRGAMMATLRCDHPDIEAFIDAKRDPGRLRMFNLSVLVTDAFMTAVEGRRRLGARVRRQGLPHGLTARALWDAHHARDLRLCRARRDLHRPRQPRGTTSHYCETIQATNPCGEQPLPPYGACLLGSINLARAGRRIRSRRRRALDMAALERLVPLAVRMLDNVIDVSRFPLPQQEKRGQGQAPHRARRHRARRRADLLRRALRLARGGAS